MPKLIECDFDRHAAAIMAIFNDAIQNSTALYEYKPRTLDTMRKWFDTKAAGNYPIIGIENDSGELLAFASYGAFRNFPGYKYTVEHSVYVAATARGQGHGKRLLEELIRRAQAQNYHTLIGVIDAANTASIKLHASLGFAECARIREVGYKFNRWLDVVFYQRILSTPKAPVDG